MNDLHVVFGTGPLGLAVMRELRRRGKPVRMVNRSSRVRFVKDVQTQVGGVDAADPVQTREACEGAAVVYHCVGLPYARWSELPRIAEGIAKGAASVQAKLIYADNLYAYGAVQIAMTENLPMAATTNKGRIRAGIARTLAALHQSGAIRVAIGRGSDFFGPGATEGAMMGTRVFGRALAGKAAQVVGNPERLHTYTFIDDFGRALVTLGERDEALGGVWHVPSAPAVTTRGFVDKVHGELGARTRLRTVPRMVLRLLGRFDQNLRELNEMLYQFERDFIMDSSRFESAFGIAATPLEESIRQTLRWYKERMAS